MKSSIFDFAEMHCSDEHPVLTNIARRTYLNTVYPQMLTGHLQGLFLQWISRLIQAHVVVEIGTFTGYSAFCFSLGLAEGGCVHTIERNPELEYLIRQNLEGHGLGSRIILHQGEAEDIIGKLPTPFDLVYLDGDKTQYLQHFELIYPHLRPGGMLMADNVWWDGKVREGTTESDARGILDFLQHVEQEKGLERLVLPLRDGLMLIRKK